MALTWTYGTSARPIVCIKTPVFEEKYEATLESNYIGEAINAEKYGQKVKGYQSEDTTAQAAAGAWRLFYQNKYYTYLISDNQIRLEQTLANSYIEAGWGEKTGADVCRMGQALLPMLKEAGGFTANNTNGNIKAVGYLTDQKYWNKYKNADSIFAMGAPSLELFIESFNSAGNKANDGRIILEASADSAGYSTKSVKVDDIKEKYNHGMYLGNLNNPYWLTGPTSASRWKYVYYMDG